MNRREAISTALIGTFHGVKFLPAADDPNADELEIKEGTALVAIRFNKKTYALGMKFIPGKPHDNTKLAHELARQLEVTINQLARFI